MSRRSRKAVFSNWMSLSGINIAIVLWISTCLCLCAQEYNFLLFDSQDGLPSSKITCLTQSNTGELWIGTDVGVSKYNGYGFENFFNHEDYIAAHVNALAIDSTSRVWIGTTTGLSYFNGQEFHRFKENGLDTISIQYLLVDANNNIVVSTLEHNYVFSDHGDNFELISDLAMVNPWSLNAGKDGNVWIGTATQLYSWESGQYTPVFEDIKWADHGVLDIIETDHTIQYTTRESQIFELDKQTGRIDVIQKQQTHYTDIKSFVLWQNQVWILHSRGLTPINEPNKSVRPPTDWNIKLINTHLIDADHSLWLGTTEGLIHVKNSFFLPIEHDLLTSEIYSTYQSIHDSIIWLGGNYGEIYQINTNGQWNKWPCPDYFGGEIVDFEEDRNGNLWMASLWKGLLYITPENITHYTSEDISINGPDLMDIYVDDKNTLWIGSNRGLYSLANGDFLAYEKVIPHFCDVYQITPATHHLWVASSCGLYHIAGDEPTPVDLPDLDQAIQIRCVFADQDLVWLGTVGSGLRCYQFQDNVLFPQYSLDILSSTVFDLAGNHAKIYAATSEGLIVIDRSQEDLSYQILSTPEGYFDDGFAHLNLSLLSNHDVFLASSKDLLKLVDSDQNSIRKSEILIDDFKVDGIAIQPSDMPSVLPARTELVEIEYTYPMLTNGRFIEYQWSLSDGKEWSDWSTDRRLLLYNPKPQFYSCRIKAQYQGKMLDEHLLQFRILPHWYQNRVFQSSILILAGLLLLYYIRKREANMKLKQRLESEKALMLASLESRLLRSQMNPHFMFNILNNLQQLILSNSTDLAQIYLEKFSRLMRMILNLSAQETVRIDKEIDFLRLYLDLESLRFEQSFSYQIEASEDLHHIEIPVFLVQPLVENAIRHGLLPLHGEKRLFIQFNEQKDFITILIRDNGIGFHNTTSKQTVDTDDQIRALDLIRERLHMIGQSTGKYSALELVANETDQGITAVLTLPLFSNIQQMQP